MKFASWTRLAAPGLVLLIAGCAGYTQRVKVEEAPTANDAYLYGRFYMNAPKAALALDGHRTMGFAIECEDKQRYVLRFDRDQPLVAVKIKPSVCSWVENIYTNADGSIESRKPAPADEFKKVTIAPGQAYYLGDFGAETKLTYRANVAYNEWAISSIRNIYHRTTRDLVQAYPKLKGLPTQDKALMNVTPSKDHPGKDIEISEADMRAEYDKFVAKQGDTEYRVRHILVSTDEKIAQVKLRLKEQQRFETIAKDYTEDGGTRLKGGDLGWSLPVHFTPPFAEALKKMKTGDRTVEPVKTEFGWHFIEVQETRPNILPDFEDVRERLMVVMRGQRDKARKAAAAAAPAAAPAVGAPAASALPVAPAASAADKPADTKPKKKKKAKPAKAEG
jgi:PPIC-type PPIASE domain